MTANLGFGGSSVRPAIGARGHQALDKDYADPAPLPVAAFQLLTPDADAFRPFDPVRRTHVVAGMVRHATARAAHAAGKPDDWIAAFVLGHGTGPHAQARADERFAYLPLPSVTPRRVESIRR